MKFLLISDEECPGLWEYGTREKLREYDLIISCGDLKASYLSHLVTLARCPLLYVHGNHDGSYDVTPPEGCDCIEDRMVEFNGVRILGLGGCRQYHPGPHQYTEKEMYRRIKKLRGKIRKAGGVDIVVTHAPAEGLGDGADPAHLGFAALRDLLDQYKPAYLCHGHVHLNYGQNQPRIIQYGVTTVINAMERYVLEVAEKPHQLRRHNEVVWKNGSPLQFDIWNPLA